MDEGTFDALARWVNQDVPRRAVARLAGGGVLAALAGSAPALAAEADASRRARQRRKRRRKITLCIEGETRRVRKTRRKAYLKQGATRGACQAACTPVCAAGTCGDDGCGGTCACPAGTVCADGTCAACTIFCTGDAATCGAALDAALVAGGDIFLCPGRYTPASPSGFTMSASTRLYGAGSGDNPATASILDQQGVSGRTVLQITLQTAVVTLSGLRITGGNSISGNGGGIHSDTDELLTITNCAVVDNKSVSTGGLYLNSPVLMIDSLVSDNQGQRTGGVYIEHPAPPQTSTIRNSVITSNKGDQTSGGIHFLSRSVTDTLIVEPTSQVTNNVIGGLADGAGGITMEAGTLGVAIATGATVTGNTEPQCIDVTGC